VPERGRTRLVARRTLRRASRSALVWGLLFGAMVANEALSYRSGFPDHRSREAFATAMSDNRGLTAVTGPARQLDTLGGFVGWRMVSLMLVAGAIWGLLTATRLTRGEEDAGRWDLLLVGRTTRRHAAAQALAGLAGAWLLLWALTAVGTLTAGLQPRVGFSVGECLLYATTGTASAAIFLALGTLTSQLGSTRRQANALAGGIFAVAWVLRMLADGGVLPGWARWTTPLGWVENLAPLTEPNLWALLPVAALTAGAAVAVVVLAGRRDVGQGLLARSASPRPLLRLLGSPLGLAVRLERWPALAWAVGLGALGLVFGLVARAAAAGTFGSQSVGSVVDRGEAAVSPAAGWIGYELLYLAAILAFAGAAQIWALRAEEESGHLAHLLARRVSRRTWLAGRLALGAAMVAVAGLAIGLGGWLGVGGRGGLGVSDLLEAAVNVAVPGLLVLGLGAGLYGVAPRLVVPVLSAFVLWSFLVEIVGSTLHASWLVHTSVLDLLGPVPAVAADWPRIGAVLAVGCLGVVCGMVGFDHRDLLET
jgi:ABC-2 type transport system permease protein